VSGRLPGDWIPRLTLDPSVFVAPGAAIVGDVTIGARAGVWFNTVIRGDTAPVTVGEETNLQDNSVIHVDEGQPAVIGARVTVGHRAIVHGCVIEDECLVGMGSIVLSGARIGAGTLVGAGALILEGQQIPPGSTVLGVPAKVVGQTKPEHREAIRRGASHYVALARSYIERGIARPLPAPADRAGLTRTDRGPMTHLEWEGLLAVIAASPEWAAARLAAHDDARWRQRPAPERWSALEVLCHLHDSDVEVFRVRLDRLLAEVWPAFAPAVMEGWETSRGYRERLPSEAHRAWSATRAALVDRLRLLRPADWERAGRHPLHGPYSLGEMARRWAEHDLSHRRQMAEALGEPA